MPNIILILQLVVLQSFQPIENYMQYQDLDIRSIYLESGVNIDLSFDVFELALKGLQKINEIQNKTIITIIDYSKPSSKERFFVIDLVNKQILYKTLVAHGRNSGEEKAESFSNNTRARSIVIHGADYVSPGFIEKYGRLGRSWGCPALPVGVSKGIIDKISEGSCIFIYGNDPDYSKKSKILNEK